MIQPEEAGAGVLETASVLVGMFRDPSCMHHMEAAAILEAIGRLLGKEMAQEGDGE